VNDSPAVIALKAKRDAVRFDGDWGRRYAKRLSAHIRGQRLKEAQERGTHTDQEWLALLEKYDYRCVRCGCTPNGRPCKDHIVPLFMGGSDSASNLQPLCRECNTGKTRDTTDWRAIRDQEGFGDKE
jgi:5-methylcytosine-specific restriction endonuclease McrA